MRRIYLDTSVFGGVYEDEHAEACSDFFRKAAQGYFVACGSEVLDDELRGAPVRVRRLFLGMQPAIHMLPVTDEALELCHAYLEAAVVPKHSRTDALHVAIATCGGCDSLVSLNFKHLASHVRQMAFNAVNTRRGYNVLPIFAPEAYYFDGRE